MHMYMQMQLVAMLVVQEGYYDWELEAEVGHRSCMDQVKWSEGRRE